MVSPLLLLKTKGSTLDLSFAKGSLPAKTSFLRSSVGTYCGSSGSLLSAAANVPRFDYDFSTHASLGLLLESASTNYNKQSKNIGTGNWMTESATTAQTITANYGTAPDGTQTSSLFTFLSTTGASASYAYIYNAGDFISLSTGQTYTLSFYAKAKSGSSATLRYGFKQQGGTWGFLSTDTKTLGTSWTRYSITQTFSASTYTLRAELNLMTLGDAAEIWGVQLEQGTSATSFIATSGATATRQADALTLTVPKGVSQLQFTFDDGSKQSVSVSAGSYTVSPASLNRSHLLKISGT